MGEAGEGGVGVVELVDRPLAETEELGGLFDAEKQPPLLLTAHRALTTSSPRRVLPLVLMTASSWV